MMKKRNRFRDVITLAYTYRHLPIGGGGYVTGFLFHPAQAGLLYARTDIGGAYRFDRQTQAWVSLIDAVTPLDLSQTYPISMALDPAQPQRLYIACGENKPGAGQLEVSDDYGETFRTYSIPVRIHGNLGGRGAGERLLVDETDASTLWFASQLEGLWVSRDEGAAWTRCEALPETALTFIAQQGDMLLVGTAGLAQRKGNRRGHSLYVSFDHGQSFAPLEEPESHEVTGARMQGLVAQRCAMDGQYAYVTFCANGPGSYIDDLGYSCDSGDTADGHIWRYELPNMTHPVDVTPEQGYAAHGYSGISAAQGLLLTATICKNGGDSIYLSRDQGASWREILHDLDVGQLCIRTPYMRPEYNGGHSIIHWLSDVKINPHNPDEAWFNTGTGVFRTNNLTADEPVFSDWCDGMEETVHLNVYAPPSGPVQVIDILGDLGGFAFTSLTEPPLNTFADAQGHRYITCINADYRDENPDHFIVTPRGNWTGKTKGGLIVTQDGGETFTRLDMPFGLSEELDELLRAIERPNVNSGWVALSADGQGIVWAVAEGIRLHARHVVYSRDAGHTFARSLVLDLDGREAQGMMKPFADRCANGIFYGFGEAGQLYVSRDGGATFRQRPAPEGFPRAHFGLIDCANRTEIRFAAGEPGVAYAATGAAGLWRLQYDMQADVFMARRLTQEGDTALRVGLGLGRPGGGYFTSPKAIYISGVIGGEYGFWRTLDEGQHFKRLNTDRQMFGEIISMDGDKRVFGRFYLATGSSGVIWGEEEE